jgi:NADH:ubiquinone oxidoreductase subunit 4 (subunit M)
MIANFTLQQSIFVIVLILCSALLSLVFTSKKESSLKNRAAIISINITTILVFCANNIFIFSFAIILALGSIVLSVESKSTRKIFTLYAVAAIVVLIIARVFFHNNAQALIHYIPLLIFLGIFPLQTWYISLFEKAPCGIMASLLCLQAITILVSPLFIEAHEINVLGPLLAILILASSSLAIIQTEARRLLAYLIASQLGFLLLSRITELGQTGLGDILITLSLIGASSSFIMLISALEARRKNLLLFRPNGCYESYPKLASWILIFGLIGSGLPLSIGYVGEDLIFERTFHDTPFIDILCLISIALNAITIMKIFLFLCQGEVKKEKGIDLRSKEIVAIYVTFISLVMAATLIN